MKGDYGRAVSSGAGDDKAALLNNAGFAAALRGDYAKAEDLLAQAIEARSAYYDRASANLSLVHNLAQKDEAAPDASR
jgi:Flp pilus assembly protein TadD